jgi:kynurenine 3-monooxygenase
VDEPVFTILGGGLVGPLLAALLGRDGHRVRLYEMRPDPRETGRGGGRSINLALSVRGTHALGQIGLLDRVRAEGIPMRGRMMHAVDGSLTFQPYGTEEDQVLLSVSRGRLNEILLDAARAHSNVEVHFEQKVVDVDPDAGTVDLLDLRSGESRRIDGGIVVGADGAYSKVRAALMRRERFDYRQDYLEYGYKELTLPPAPGGGFAMEREALHIWPRHTYMMIALPNVDATYTCTLFWPYRGPVSFESVAGGAAASAFFGRIFPDVLPLLPDLAGEYERNPVGSLVTVRCRPWRAGGTAVLIGDAAHAVVPFYGQGLNAGFEDCTVFMESLRAHAPDWERAFADYEARRKENTDALAELAVENFVEMRDKTGSRRFLWRKRTERVLHRLFPRWYLPLYGMITFSRIPYAEARRRGPRQDRALLIAAGILAALVLLWLGGSAR